MSQLASKEAELILKSERIQHLEELVTARDRVISEKERQVSEIGHQLELTRRNSGAEEEVRRLTELVRELGTANAAQGRKIRVLSQELGSQPRPPDEAVAIVHNHHAGSRAPPAAGGRVVGGKEGRKEGTAAGDYDQRGIFSAWTDADHDQISALKSDIWDI